MTGNQRSAQNDPASLYLRDRARMVTGLLHTNYRKVPSVDLALPTRWLMENSGIGRASCSEGDRRNRLLLSRGTHPKPIVAACGQQGCCRRRKILQRTWGLGPGRLLETNRHDLPRRFCWRGNSFARFPYWAFLLPDTLLVALSRCWSLSAPAGLT